MFHRNWKGRIWGMDLGLVLCRDGVTEVQDGDGRFHGAWSARSGPGWTPRSCQGIWSFFIVRSQCFQDGADGQYSLPGTCRVFFVFFFFKSLHWVVFSALHCQDTQAVCIVCVSSLNSFRVGGCDLCVSFLPSTFWFSCLWFSFWWKQVFVPHLSFARDKIDRFCKKWDSGGGNPTKHSTPAPLSNRRYRVW